MKQLRVFDSRYKAKMYCIQNGIEIYSISRIWWDGDREKFIVMTPLMYEPYTDDPTEDYRKKVIS